MSCAAYPDEETLREKVSGGHEPEAAAGGAYVRRRDHGRDGLCGLLRLRTDGRCCGRSLSPSSLCFVGRVLDKVEDNLLVYNLLLAFLSEVVIIGMAALGIGTHAGHGS